MTSPAAPSLLGARAGAAAAALRTGVTTGAPTEARTLLDLMYDGFYMLFLLKNRFRPHAGEAFPPRPRGGPRGPGGATAATVPVSAMAGSSPSSATAR